MPHWGLLANDEDGGESTQPTRFIRDNDIDQELLRFMQGHGASIIRIPPRLRSAPDEEVLAEAKRQNRVLISHDQRFVNPHLVNRAENPGIIILPRDGRGRFDWSLVSAILAHIYVSSYRISETVFRVYPSWRFTIWKSRRIH
jgi:hypothetical protein